MIYEIILHNIKYFSLFTIRLTEIENQYAVAELVL